MKLLEQNAIGFAELTVSEADLASSVGSGSLRVLATPTMIMLMEKAACNCLADALEGDETTVGTEIAVKHLSATPCGMNVRAEAVLTENEGRKYCFTVKAYDESGLIGEGTHERFLVYGERFTAKANSKLR
ncbi:MAG: thioesterase family protein [Ruminococcus sp.]|nr:thioesterase family protein [Ruminococcus sp.]